MKLGENEGLRELLARLIELLRLEAEEEGAMFRLAGESGAGVRQPGRAADGGAAVQELPSELLGLIGSALSRLDPGGQLSVLLSGRQPDGNRAIVIAELGREWIRIAESPAGSQKEGEPSSGSIEVDSVAGLGTTFTIRLPEEGLER